MENEGLDTAEIEWYVRKVKAMDKIANLGSISGNMTCRITYRRIVDMSSSESNMDDITRVSSIHAPSSTPKRSRSNDEDEPADDDMKQYTRVQILVPAVTSPRPRKRRRLVSAREL